ncbi:ferredoxin reductase [Actinomadura fulvescens]|uniref:Ferredoxin reductase n=1 Tax=Actinomadura fulvescens TaxID=46160 RepID=A0ABP6C8E7_9ACTN
MITTPLRRLGDTARWLTTPLLPEDYLSLLNPLWSTAELRGRIEAIRHEAPGAATIVIRPGRDWPGHRPGQWVKIGIDLDGVRHWRTFSLSSPPREDGLLTITVKATEDGTVSRHLVHRARPRTIVRLSEPEGDFVLPDRLPDRILFITAGSGITPVMAMLRALAKNLPASSADPRQLNGQPKPDRRGDADQGAGAAQAAGSGRLDIVIVHSARTPGEVIFGDELRALARRVPGVRLYERHTAEDGRFKPAELAEICPDWAERDTWACGPGDLLDDLDEHWQAAGADERLRMERFRPVLAVTDGEGGRVTFSKSGVEAEADGATPLLVAGEAAGALLPSGCRMGICYSCVGRLCSGKVRDLRTGEVHGEEGQLIQTCISAAAGPVDIEL